MKKITKIMMSIIALTLVFLLSVSSFAAAKTVISCGSVTAKAGETVTIDVEITNNPGISSMRFNVGYDATIMSLKSVENVGTLKNLQFVPGNDVSKNPFIVGFLGLASEDSSNGIICTLTFEIKDSVSAGEYDISLSLLSCFNLNNETIDVSMNSGSIVIEEETAEPTTATPTTAVATTAAPTTVAPTTVAPTTVAPTTEPSTESKTTEPMVTTEVVATTTETETTDVIVTTTEPTTDDKIPQTGESVAITVIAGVFVLAGVAFLATKKKED